MSAAARSVLPTVAMGATALFTITQVAADVVPRGPVLAVAVLVASVLFVAGLAAFVWGFVLAAGRSRDEAITLTGLYLLQGTAPPEVRRQLLGSLGTQIVVAFATAGVRPFTPLAFGILVPLFGVGLTGLWAARHGTFFAVDATPEERAAAAEQAGHRPPRAPADDEDPDDFDQLFRRRRRRHD